VWRPRWAQPAARGAPDGDTLLPATSTTLAINKALYRKLAYDPVRDFTPIALVAGRQPVAAGQDAAGIHRLRQIHPGLAYGSAGNGSPQHLGAETLKAAAPQPGSPARGSRRRRAGSG